MKTVLSGYCDITMHHHDFEIQDYNIIGEDPNVQEYTDLDIDIVPLLEKDHRVTDLEDGYWHVYFTGRVTVSVDQNYECRFPDDITVEVELEQVFTKKLKE